MATKTIKYTPALGRMVASEAQGMDGTYHVVPSMAKWAIVPDGKVRAIRIFDSKPAAVAYARRAATKKYGMVVVHDRQGNVQTRY